MINTKLQNIIDTKSAIGNAIVNKGGTINSATPFYEYAPAIENISTGGGAYSTFVAQAQDNSLYTVYTGYDAIINVTPNLSKNFPFNQWLLNNSATGSIILPNVVVANGGTFNGVNTVANESTLTFVGNTAAYIGLTDPTDIYNIAINNGIIYVGGFSSARVRRYYESNLANITSSTNTYGGPIHAITINNGFLYVGGQTNQRVQKFHQSNLVFVGSTNSFGATIFTLATNNGIIYASGGATVGKIKTYYESNLVAINETADNIGTVDSLKIDNGFIYASSNSTNGASVIKFYENNLVFINNTADYGGRIFSIDYKDGFIYVGGNVLTGTNRGVSKFNADNLALVGNTVNYGGGIRSVIANNDFIYVGGATNHRVQKFHAGNLVFVGNTNIYATANTINSIAINNGHIYVGGLNNFSGTAARVEKFKAQNITTFDNQTFYNITSIKE